jgi:hypothetical protein
MPLDTLTYINNWVVMGGRFTTWNDDEFGIVIAYHNIGSPENGKEKFIANHKTLNEALDELAEVLRKESEEPVIELKKEKTKKK